MSLLAMGYRGASEERRNEENLLEPRSLQSLNKGLEPTKVASLACGAKR